MMFSSHALAITTPTMALIALLAHLLFKAVVVFALTWMVTRDITKLIAALNGIGPQLAAVIVLGIGFFMLLVSKWYGIDTSISGGVIGASLNMLTGQGLPGKKDVLELPGAQANAPK